MDGKHIRILHPYGSGSDFNNYKGFFSIVLLALVDYDYKFTYVDVGCQGRISGGGVYRNSTFYQALIQKKLNLPHPKILWIEQSTSDDVLPYTFVADDAFPLSEHCMKRYPHRSLSDDKRIFSYRLSRARRLSENVFGIWGSRFRIFQSTICLNPEVAVKVVLATIVLHNYLRMSSDTYTPKGSIDEEGDSGCVTHGEWRNVPNSETVSSLGRLGGNRPTKSVEEIRDTLCRHFCGAGQVPWQWKKLV